MQKNSIPLRKNTFNNKYSYTFGLKCNIATKIIINSIFARMPLTKLKLLPKSKLLHKGTYNFSKITKIPLLNTANFCSQTRINTKYTH